MVHRTRAELEAGLGPIRSAPADGGAIELIVRRPDVGVREEIDEAVLDPVVGLVGDNWLARGSRRTSDGEADPACQLTIMSSRAAALFAGERNHWAIAGDQLYVDMDLSMTSLPAGARVRIGEALVEISETPHKGCAKFLERFGRDASRMLATPDGRELRLRGLNAVVVEGGAVKVGDRLHRV